MFFDSSGDSIDGVKGEAITNLSFICRERSSFSGSAWQGGENNKKTASNTHGVMQDFFMISPFLVYPVMMFPKYGQSDSL